MRIAYLLTSLGVGGAEKQVVALAERMSARGHAVLLVVLRERQLEEWPTCLPVAYLDMGKTPAGLFRGLWRACRTMRGFKPDLVHSHTFPANLFARVLRALGAAPGVVCTIHSVFDGGRLRMGLYRLTDSLALHTTAVSEAVAERVIACRAVPRKKCIVMANAIDTAEFAPSAERRAVMREKLAAGEDFVWLAVGRMVAAKDYPNLMQAFEQVWPEFPGVQLWIAGEALGSGARQEKAERVRWLGLRRDIPALLDAADGFVLSSAWEGMPLVVGEAMAMETPVVATDVGGVRELMGATGVTVPAKSPEALASAMLAQMHLPAEQRGKQGKEARARIVKNFSMDARADEWEGFYAAMLRSRG